MILMRTPKRGGNGGVITFISSLKPYIEEYCIFFETGSQGESSFIKTIIRLAIDYINFIKQLLFRPQITLIILNTSFDEKSIWRDILFVLISRICRKPIVWFFHGWKHNYENQFLKAKYKNVIVYGMNSADAIYVLSNQIRASLLSFGVKIEINLYNTVVPDEFWGCDRTTNNTNKHLNILFLSRIEKEKGIYETVEAFTNLAGKYKNIKLLIAGDGSEFSNVAKLCVDNENIGILGYVGGQKKKELFQKADIYVLPSYTEGMPITVLEAMASGIPVITCPVGALKEFFEIGKMGYLVNSRDTVSLSEKIELLLLDAEKRVCMSEYNLEYSKKYFGASKMAEKIEMIYDKYRINRAECTNY